MLVDADQTWSFKQILTSAWLKANTTLLSPEKMDRTGDTKTSRGMKKFNCDNSNFWTNLKGSFQIEFRLCYLNIYLKDVLEIWALLWIWISALQKQAKLAFSKVELSFTKIYFFAFQGMFFQDCTMKKNSTENNVQTDCENLLIQ